MQYDDSQNHPHHPGALHGDVPTLCWLLLLQRHADGAAGSSRLLGWLDLTHGLQVTERQCENQQQRILT